MLRGDAFVAEVAVDLINAVQPAHGEALQVKFRRNAQVQIHIERIVMGNKRTCRGAAGDGMHHRRFHFDVSALVEEAADFANDGRALDEHVPRISVRDQIQITLAVTNLHILKPMPFFRQWQ